MASGFSRKTVRRRSLIEKRYRIGGPDDARLNHRRVKAAQAPSRRLRIAGLHSRIINRGLDAGAVHVERRARQAYLRQLNRGVADPKALPEAQLAAVETASREVLAERAGEQREALRDELVDPFDGDQENRLAPAAVERVAPRVPGDPGLGQLRPTGSRASECRPATR